MKWKIKQRNNNYYCCVCVESHRSDMQLMNVEAIKTHINETWDCEFIRFVYVQLYSDVCISFLFLSLALYLLVPINLMFTDMCLYAMTGRLLLPLSVYSPTISIWDWKFTTNSDRNACPFIHPIWVKRFGEETTLRYVMSWYNSKSNRFYFIAYSQQLFLAWNCYECAWVRVQSFVVKMSNLDCVCIYAVVFVQFSNFSQSVDDSLDLFEVETVFRVDTVRNR